MTDKRHSVVCFSGHRKYTGGPEDGARLEAALVAAYGDGYRVFISGMAPGFDLAAAEAVVRLRDGAANGATGASGAAGAAGASGAAHPDVRLIAAVPFAAQASGYSADDRARYETLLGASDEVCVLESRYSHGCYYRRDEWMVERSGRIICWFDASGGSELSGRKAGGTRYTVRQALRSSLEVVNTFRAPGSLF